jgi:PPOX class probable F420-dependent enzyme
VEPAIRALLEGPNFGHLATLMADGAPHSVALWVTVLNGDRLGFVADPRSLKGRNIARDPRVALSIVDHEDPYRTAQLRGRVVTTQKGDAALEMLHAISRRYTGADYPEPGGVLYEVEIDWAAFTDLSRRVARRAASRRC